MLKRLIALLLILLLPAAASGETLYYGSSESGVEAALAVAVCVALGWEPSAQSSGADAWSRLMAQKEGFAIGTQQQLIEGLQGYTAEDPRQALQSVMPLGGNDLYLICAAETAESLFLHDLPSLRTYLTEHPYELVLMRSFTASITDLAAFHLLETLEFDSDTFVDEADCAACLADGPYVLVADTQGALRLAAEGHTVLGPLTETRTKEYPALPCAAECGLPAYAGTCYMLFAPAGTQTVGIVPALETLLGDAGFTTVLDNANLHPVRPEAFSWRDTIDDLVAYMTAEGLFFYDSSF